MEPTSYLPSFLALISTLLGFMTVVYLSASNMRFAKGQIQRIIANFIWGTFFMFGAMVSQFYVEFVTLPGTWVNLLKHIFLLGGFLYYFFASYETYKMSRVLGFVGKELPKKLKRILKS